MHVTTYLGRGVARFRRSDSVTVSLDDGQRLESDLAVLAYGTVPASGWATGPRTARGRRPAPILAMPGVYAAGSVAIHDPRRPRYRVDHWDAATAQGAHAARSFLHDIAGGEDPGRTHPRRGST